MEGSIGAAQDPVDWFLESVKSIPEPVFDRYLFSSNARVKLAHFGFVNQRVVLPQNMVSTSGESLGIPLSRLPGAATGVWHRIIEALNEGFKGEWAKQARTRANQVTQSTVQAAYSLRVPFPSLFLLLAYTWTSERRKGKNIRFDKGLKVGIEADQGTAEDLLKAIEAIVRATDYCTAQRNKVGSTSVFLEPSVGKVIESSLSEAVTNRSIKEVVEGLRSHNIDAATTDWTAAIEKEVGRKADEHLTVAEYLTVLKAIIQIWLDHGRRTTEMLTQHATRGVASANAPDREGAPTDPTHLAFEAAVELVRQGGASGAVTTVESLFSDTWEIPITARKHRQWRSGRGARILDLLQNT